MEEGTPYCTGIELLVASAMALVFHRCKSYHHEGTFLIHETSVTYDPSHRVLALGVMGRLCRKRAVELYVAC